MKIEKFTFGMGDRFGREGEAQLAAVVAAKDMGIDVHPVWNKSNREHTLVSTHPDDVRVEADNAVKALGWNAPYYVDADHIGLKTVAPFVAGADFFTLDVAESIDKPASPETQARFVDLVRKLGSRVEIPGLAQPVELGEVAIAAASQKFLGAIEEAGRIYRHILEEKGEGKFIVEVSIDETDNPQTPTELLLILAMIASEGVPAQTIAPKFTGRFNKGVDYVGDLAQFEKEFDEDLYVIAYAVKEFGLPETLKLSVHSGSDKFSLYPIIKKLIRKHGCGLHVKTAGTTWLEEVIGLAEAGGEGLQIAKDIYCKALDLYDELTGPYRTVLDIDKSKLPDAATVANWDSADYVSALRHDQSNPAYNLHFRQLIHVAFKLAAKMGDRYMTALEENRGVIAKNVTFNLLERHIVLIFRD